MRDRIGRGLDWEGVETLEIFDTAEEAALPRPLPPPPPPLPRAAPPPAPSQTPPPRRLIRLVHYSTSRFDSDRLPIFVPERLRPSPIWQSFYAPVAPEASLEPGDDTLECDMEFSSDEE